MSAALFLLLSLLPAGPAAAGAFDELSLGVPGAAEVAVPAPPAPEALPETRAVAAVPACPANMRGDRATPCKAVTQKTTICSDGMKIDRAKVTAQEVRAGKFPKGELGKYKNPDLRRWALHQEGLGKSANWADGSHQSVLATGGANPFTTPYVVLPNRAWLGRKVTVCVSDTGACVEATALEVGPKTTFKDHAELSVGAMMELGLDAHPNEGTYYGEMTFLFH